MRLATIFVTVFAFCLAGLMAQDELTQYQTWMKAAAGARGAAMKSIQAKDVPAAAASAKTVAENFDEMAKFWQGKGKADAQAFAETARDAAKAAAAATTPEEQQAAMQKSGPTCTGCHMVYRDQNKFKGL
jgi:cytochrome c556